MSKTSREYQRLYMRRYRFERQCRGHDHVPTVAVPPEPVIGPDPPTPDEVLGAKQSLASAHRLRAIGVHIQKDAPEGA